MIKKIGGRKFILTIIIVAFAFSLTITKQIEANVFLEFAKWILGIYGVTNVASKVAEK